MENRYLVPCAKVNVSYGIVAMMALQSVPVLEMRQNCIMNQVGSVGCALTGTSELTCQKEFCSQDTVAS